MLPTPPVEKPRPRRQSQCGQAVGRAARAWWGTSSLTRTQKQSRCRLNSTTVRTITRIFVRDGAGARTLWQTTEEERRTLSQAGGVKNRTCCLGPRLRWQASADPGAKFPKPRKSLATWKRRKQRLCYPASLGGWLLPCKSRSGQQRTGNNTEFKKTVQGLDAGSGKWQVSEVQQRSTKEEGDSYVPS